MEDNNQSGSTPVPGVRDVVREAIAEFMRAEQTKAEPAYKTELVEERRRRESLEKRLTELEAENRRTREIAEETERHSQIRSELQRLGVQKIDLAFKAVKDDIQRREDGRLVAQQNGEEVTVGQFLQTFVAENPELLPARIAGGSGSAAANRPAAAPPAAPIDLDKIHPGMSPEEMERVRQEIARLASQTLRGA